MKKIISFFIISVLLLSALTGCNNKSGIPLVTPIPLVSPVPDTSTSASIATDEAKLTKATSKDGTWIVILKNNLSANKEVVVEGEPAKPGSTVPPGRKLALYDQDANRNKTASYTLTAPKLTIRTPNSNIWGGTFVGDVYVEATGFNLVDAKVQGNIYFLNDILKSSFKMDDKSSVTGAQEVKS